MKIERFELGPFATNAYLFFDPTSKKGIVIDPGMNPLSLLNRIRELNLTIVAILLTHAHCDHIGGLEELRQLTQAPVYIHKDEVEWLANPHLNGSALLPGVAPFSCQPPENKLQGDETLTLLNQTFKVVHTPGHSPGSVTYVSENQVFSGDVLFMDSIGRTDLPGGNYATLMQSIRQHLLSLANDTLVYPGHGPSTSVGRERLNNPFIRGG